MIGVRIAGRTVLGRINSGTKAVYSYLMSTPGTFDKHDPTTGEVIAQYKNFTPDEVFATVASEKEAAISWQALDFRGRKKVLRNWAALITSRINEIAELIAQETGKPIGDSKLEASIAVDHLAWAAKHAEEIMQTQNRAPGILMFNMKAQVKS